MQRSVLEPMLWVVLALLVAGFYWMQQTNRAALAAQGAQAQHGMNLGLRFTSRYAIGVHHLLERFGEADEQTVQQLADSLPRLAENPADELRVAMVLGELQGAAEAQARIAELLDDQNLPAAVRDDALALQQLYETGPASVARAQQQQLIARHGWFGYVALSYDRPPSHPVRKRALGPAVRAMVSIVTAMGLLLLAALAGLTLFIVMIVLVLSERLRLALPQHLPALSQPRTALLETFILFLLATAAVVVAAGLLQAVVGMDLQWLAVWVLPIVLLWPMVRGMPGSELRLALGWHRGRGFFTEVGSGIVGLLAGLPIVGMGITITAMLALYSQAPTGHPIADEAVQGGGFTIVRMYLLACVWAPLVEELVFRGALYAHLRTRMRAVVSAALVALIFAAIHPQGWAAIPALASLGFVFALIREWRSSIIAPITAHACNNGFVITLLVLAVM